MDQEYHKGNQTNSVLDQGNKGSNSGIKQFSVETIASDKSQNDQDGHRRPRNSEGE